MAGPLATFRDRLAGLKGPAFIQTRNELIGQRLEALVLKEFQQSVNPYGVAWKAVARRARRGGAGKPLIRSGALRRSHVSSGSTSSVVIGLADPTAIFAQKGTRPKLHAARAARQNARGRFVGRSAKIAYLLRIREYTHPGIERRQILPETKTGGLPASWQADIAKVIRIATRDQLKAGS